MFSEISFITATKPTPTSKLGIAYNVTPAGVIMDGINEGSLFDNTKLKAGHLIVSVNGTSMASLTRPQVGAVFGSLTKDICLEVWTPLNCSRDQVPAILSEGGQTPVPLIKWQQIYDQVVNNMIPASNAYKELRKEFQGHMKHFVKNQMIKGGLIGLGTESKGERDMLLLTNQLGSVANNATLVSNNILGMSNASLNSHGIATMIGLETMNAGKSKWIIPDGIGFMIIE